MDDEIKDVISESLSSYPDASNYLIRKNIWDCRSKYL